MQALRERALLFATVFVDGFTFDILHREIRRSARMDARIV